MSQRDSVLPWHSREFYAQAHEMSASRVRFSDHQGKRILVVDFSRADLELVRAVAAECLHVMSMQPPNSVLSLVEVEGIPFHTEALKIGAELTAKVEQYAIRTALSGVIGFRSFMLQAIADAARRPIRLFKEREKALQWLVGEEAEAAGR